MRSVSFVVPTKNRVELLVETLDTIAAQSAPNWEAVVVDDGSTDDTVALLRARAAADTRIRVIERARLRPERSGAQICRNLGLSQVEGDYVIFLDSDDLLASTCVEQRYCFMEQNRHLDFAAWRCRIFDQRPEDSSSVWGAWADGQDDLLEFLRGNVLWQTSGPIWRRSALDKVGPWDESLVGGHHDYEFHVRALARGLCYQRVDEVDFYWRAPREDSMSSFDSFKRWYRSRDYIDAFRLVVSAATAGGPLSPRRRKALWRQAVKVAALARMFGADAAAARAALRSAYEGGCGSAFDYIEASILATLWLRIGRRLPTLAYLNAKYHLEDVR